MNPVSFYYCFDAAGARLETIVAEITNTPWKERHQYVLPVAAAGEVGAHAGTTALPIRQELSRIALHAHGHAVSLVLQRAGERLFVNMQNFQAGQRLFDATLACEPNPFQHRAAARAHDISADDSQGHRGHSLAGAEALAEAHPFYSHAKTSES
jgi:DUF1365 family protein